MKEKILPEVKKVNLKLRGKTYIDKFYEEEEIKKKYGTVEQKFTLASEVKSLSYLAQVTFNQKTQKMIRNQKDSRRQRQLRALDVFEETIKEFNGKLNMKSDAVKNQIISFFDESQEEIMKYFESLTDEVLLVREIDFVKELMDIIANHKQHREA